jgi:hypothetical protein
MKTMKCILPILIGIFVVSGTLISLPLLKYNLSKGETGYELSDGEAAITASPIAKKVFVLPLIPVSFEAFNPSVNRPVPKVRNYQPLFSKVILRNVLMARAP